MRRSGETLPPWHQAEASGFPDLALQGSEPSSLAGDLDSLSRLSLSTGDQAVYRSLVEPPEVQREPERNLESEAVNVWAVFEPPNKTT